MFHTDDIDHNKRLLKEHIINVHQTFNTQANLTFPEINLDDDILDAFDQHDVTPLNIPELGVGPRILKNSAFNEWTQTWRTMNSSFKHKSFTLP